MAYDKSGRYFGEAVVPKEVQEQLDAKRKAAVERPVEEKPAEAKPFVFDSPKIEASKTDKPVK